MLPIELLLNIYTFCDIDTRLKLQKLGIHKKINVYIPKLNIQKPRWFGVPRLQTLTHKSSIHYIEKSNSRTKYRLMYISIHKRGPWTIEVFLVQSLNRFGFVKRAWELDLDTNEWKKRKM